MSFMHHNRYDLNRRRRRPLHPSSHTTSSLTLSTLATTAAVAYGAYRLGSWAWNSYFGDDDDDDDGDNIHSHDEYGGTVDEDGDLLYEWCQDQKPNRQSTRGSAKSRTLRPQKHDDDEEDEAIMMTHSQEDLFLEAERKDIFANHDPDHHSCGKNNASKSNGQSGQPSSMPPFRSRRSRHDWSEENHHKRSHRPSPKYNKDEMKAKSTQHTNNHQNRNGENEKSKEGLISRGMSKAASLATAGVTSAMNAALASQLEGTTMSSLASLDNPFQNNNGGGNKNDTTTTTTTATKATATISPFLRNTRLARCRVESTRAMLDFLPTLKKAVAKETDVSKETGELKRMRIKRKEILERHGGGKVGEEVTGESEESTIRDRERLLWNAIKIKSITRLITTAYAHTIVFLVLTVQVNLLGGRLLREEVEERSKSSSLSSSSSSPQNNDSTTSSPAHKGADRYRSSHQTVLAQTYHHVFSKGIPSLAAEVANAVDEATRQHDVLGAIYNGDNPSNLLKNDASLEDVSSWMECVRDQVEQRQQHRQPRGKSMILSSLAKFVIPPEDEDGNNAEDDTANNRGSMDELARYILDETFDLLESPTFANAERSCLDATFSELREDRYAKLFSHSSSSRSASDKEGGFKKEEKNDNGDEEGEAGKEEDEDERKPLANVVTHLQKSAVATFHRPPSHKEEMESWGGVLGMMEEPLPSAPNSYLSKLERLSAVLELGDVCFD